MYMLFEQFLKERKYIKKLIGTHFEFLQAEL